MAQRYEFVTVDRVLAKHARDLRGHDIHESDALEWIGEALGFMKVPNVSEEAVAFVEVKNHEAELPSSFHYITQVAKYNGADQLTISDVVYDGATESTPETEDDTVEPQVGVALDENGNLIDDTYYAYYRPYFDLQYEYLGWANARIRQTAFSPVRLADHTFFNSIVCKEEDERIKELYKSCGDEYTVVQNTRKLRFSFKEGFVAVAFTRQMIDKETGYPMIPDNQYCINAINYYMTWMLWQRQFYLNRDGAERKMMYAERNWEKYIRRFKNHAKQPFGVDDYEDLKNQSKYLIPRNNVYDNFFGNLSNSENRSFNNPRSNYRR